MRYWIVVAMAVAGIALPTQASAHDADRGECLHRSDFREIVWSYTPYSRWYTHQVFGVTGRVVDESTGSETRVYQGCGEGTSDRAWISYTQDDEGTYRVDGFSYTMEYFGDGLATPSPRMVRP